jgi:hypothetical protein
MKNSSINKSIILTLSICTVEFDIAPYSYFDHHISISPLIFQSIFQFLAVKWKPKLVTMQKISSYAYFLLTAQRSNSILSTWDFFLLTLSSVMKQNRILVVEWSHLRRRRRSHDKLRSNSQKADRLEDGFREEKSYFFSTFVVCEMFREHG